MKNIAVLASGQGTNFQAIIDAVNSEKIKANLSLLISDSPQAYAIERAKQAEIKFICIERKDFNSRQEFEAAIIQQLQEHNVDLIVLAGFMRILGDEIIKAYENRIINIHPALLPSFKGAHGIKDAFDYGVKVTGVTVHFVDQEMDHGPIIAQEQVVIEENDTQESLEEKIHKVEHQIYSRCINLFVEGKLKIEGRKVKII